MPSLRKRVSSYFRQLSFHNEPRDKRHNINENSFVTKYLQGHVTLREGPPIIYGKNPTDLPNYELGEYETGSSSVIGCYTGPKGGLTTVKRTEKHLSVPDTDIDFIDTQDECVAPPVKKSPKRPVDNTTMVIKVAGQEYCVTNRTKKHNKSHSLGSISDFNLEIETTRIDKEFYNNNNADEVKCKVGSIDDSGGVGDDKSDNRENFGLAKSKSEGNPFQHKKRGKIIKVAQRADSRGGDTPGDASSYTTPPDDSSLPSEWTKKSDLVFGISDSLYDRNQVTDNKNGDPIADCFGIIARENSAILAVADGVNWGEKASIAAKSAVHGSLHYLNKTIFNDTKPFERLTIKPEETSDASAACTRVGNTREIFVCLLRAFSCAHDLILENKGMLTTLTVAVVVPLKRRDGTQRYVCCVCNVGDTLAYVYSQRHGLRELTKGSHDINCNRDMRDALGALGPVDGINPELSNLTLSITTLNKGDLVMVASDGLTDNFDPNVCRFTVNSRLGEAPKVGRSEPPIKPPRRTVPPRRPAQVTDNKTSSLRKQISSQNKEGQKFSRSKTTIEVRPGGGVRHHVARNEEGIPYVTPLQRYELQLLLIEDVLRHGISGRDDPCTTAKKLCESLVSFTFSITSAKRHTLEDQDLYFDNQNGVLVEVSQQEKKIRRKKGLEKVQNLPGKLDHVTVVAWNVGNFTQSCN
ncbi:PP2C-like domain-containing protein CG9801 isoform X1 [Tribolium madens]|uniref:PP2C-like domain-containing protein CG9801 isoform X1 n=1 Tax=Tribolium madens TaxID=41895 RepID=UPI001CF724C6|nr:PP2C-like domain-containing protein CG9801 isoform X1 [Tribolium madens]